MKGLILTVVLVILFLPAESRAEEKRYAIPILDSPSVGPENASVTVVEFIDFQ